MFRQGFSCPVLLDFIDKSVSCTGLSPTTAALSRAFHYTQINLRASPRSLATTKGISVDFFSSGYLDVSVLLVCSHCWVTYLQYAGLPHSDISGSIRVCRSPELFAAYHVLLRLWKPRHPPYALNDFFPIFRLLKRFLALGFLFVMSLPLMSMIFISF